MRSLHKNNPLPEGEETDSPHRSMRAFLLALELGRSMFGV
jgi:hypothetical protein